MKKVLFIACMVLTSLNPFHSQSLFADEELAQGEYEYQGYSSAPSSGTEYGFSASTIGLGLGVAAIVTAAVLVATAGSGSTAHN